MYLELFIIMWDWGLTHVMCKWDMKGMLWVLQQVTPIEAVQGILKEGNPVTISDQSVILS